MSCGPVINLLKILQNFAKQAMTKGHKPFTKLYGYGNALTINGPLRDSNVFTKNFQNNSFHIQNFLHVLIIIIILSFMYNMRSK